MAVIQNSAIIQKLIDELELYPALDKIPTELADKVLPVFQVNTETLEIQMKPNYLLWQDVLANDSDKTLTVPDGHTYVLKHGFIKIACSSDVGNRKFEILIKDKAGHIVWVVEAAAVLTADDVQYWRISDLYHLQIAGEAEQYYNKMTTPLPQDFVMLEGWTLRFWDHAAIAAAADDIEMSFIVDDQAD